MLQNVPCLSVDEVYWLRDLAVDVLGASTLSQPLQPSQVQSQMLETETEIYDSCDLTVSTVFSAWMIRRHISQQKRATVTQLRRCHSHQLPLNYLNQVIQVDKIPCIIQRTTTSFHKGYHLFIACPSLVQTTRLSDHRLCTHPSYSSVNVLIIR